jgi:hypothetical protein
VLVSGCLQLVKEAVICLRKVDNLKLSAHRHCDRGRYRIRLESAVHSHSGQFTDLPVLCLGRNLSGKVCWRGCEVGWRGCTAVMSSWMLPTGRLYDARMRRMLLES